MNKKPEEETPRAEGEAPKTQKVIEDFVLGNDPGASFLFNLMAKLEFIDIPYLRKYKVRPFIFGEMVCYPPYSRGSSLNLKQNTRGGIGYGISIPFPINENMNMSFYQNLLLFNTNNKGDVARTKMLEFEIGLF